MNYSQWRSHGGHREARAPTKSWLCHWLQCYEITNTLWILLNASIQGNRLRIWVNIILGYFAVTLWLGSAPCLNLTCTKLVLMYVTYLDRTSAIEKHPAENDGSYEVCYDIYTATPLTSHWRNNCDGHRQRFPWNYCKRHKLTVYNTRAWQVICWGVWRIAYFAVSQITWFSCLKIRLAWLWCTYESIELHCCIMCDFSEMSSNAIDVRILPELLLLVCNNLHDFNQ